MSNEKLKYADFVSMSSDELYLFLTERKRSLLNFRFRKKFMDSAVLSLFKKYRKDIARVSTEISKRKNQSGSYA